MGGWDISGGKGRLKERLNLILIIVSSLLHFLPSRLAPIIDSDENFTARVCVWLSARGIGYTQTCDGIDRVNDAVPPPPFGRLPRELLHANAGHLTGLGTLVSFFLFLSVVIDGNRILFLTWDDEIVLRRQKFCLWRLDAHQWAVRHPTIRCWKEKRVSFGWKGLAEWMPHPRYPSFLPSLFCDFDFAFLGVPHIFEWCASQTHNGRAAKALFFSPTDSQSSSMFFFFFSFSFSFFGGLRGFLDVQDSFLSFLLLFLFLFLGNIYCRLGIIEK